MDSPKKIRWPRLVTGVVVMLFAGIIYAWSIINAPFRQLGMDTSQLGLNFTLTIVFFCLGGLGSGLISKQTSVRLRLALSALMLFSSFYITSILIFTMELTGDFHLLYMSYGVLGGLGIGMAYNTVITTVNAWFPDKRGLCSGILMMGFGFSALLIGRLADYMGQSEAYGWRDTYAAIGIALGVVLLIAAFLIKPPPPGTVFPQTKTKAEKKDRPEGETADLTPLEMIKRPSFIMIFVYVTLLASSGSAALSFARDIVLDVGAAESLAVTAVGILGIFNGLGRLTCGFLFDKLGIRKTQFISSSTAILAPLTVVGALMFSSLPLGLIGLCLCAFSYGFAPTTLSVFAAEFYGPKNFPLNFSIFNLVLIPAPFAATLAGSIKTATGEFMIAFLILTACTLVGFLINIGIRKP